MKGYISLEGLIIICVLFLIFVVFSIGLIQNQSHISRTRDLIDMKSSCDRLSNEINSLYVLGSGSESKLIIGNEIFISDRSLHSGDILCDTCCNLSSTYTNISGIIKLRNDNGNIILEVIS